VTYIVQVCTESRYFCYLISRSQCAAAALNGFVYVISWIILHPHLLHATNTKYDAMYVNLSPGIHLNLHKIKRYSAVLCVVVV